MNNLTNVTGVPTIPAVPMNNPGNTRMILTTVNIAGIWVSAGLAMWGGYRACKEIQERQITDPKQRALIFAKWGVPAMLTGGITTWAAVTNYRISNEQILAASSTALLLKEKAQKQIELKKEQEKKAAEEEATKAKTNGEVTKDRVLNASVNASDCSQRNMAMDWYDPYINAYYKNVSMADIDLALKSLSSDAIKKPSAFKSEMPYSDFLSYLEDQTNTIIEVPKFAYLHGWYNDDCDVYVVDADKWKTGPDGKPYRILTLSSEPKPFSDTPFDEK